jgi:hypothetical protein
MSMLGCGIIGLPLSGKTTVFNVITGSGAEVKPYAGGKTDPNRAIVEVPDERVDRLTALFNPKKRTPAQVEFVDLAGLSRDASRGAGLGNSFLSFVAEADALVHVLRAFDNPEVPHPEESIDPLRDWNIVETELILRDLGVTETRLNRLSAKKKLLPEEQVEAELLRRCQEHLLDEKPLRDMPLTEEQVRLLRGFTFVSLKPELVVLNLDETQVTRESIPGIEGLEALCVSRGMPLVKVYGRMEMELGALAPEEQAEFMAELKVEETGRKRLISGAYGLLGLMSFFTVGPDEVRAWTLKNRSTAVEAAGTIHSDLARGFIRAQVVNYEEFMKHGGSFAACREAGVLRLEGKEYPVSDGDILEIRFNV